ncbi:unnamed protein product [Adineta ricciae]|uniref:Uncharacterized protein n=1 Tax=Adineta ricciae TaxID=249248 RepID=A0A814R2A7_ADIRI|nr:unnamed protein product [Adineta ricciae]CAF1127590.1 unnamed protein product [Adineta ricciae]
MDPTPDELRHASNRSNNGLRTDSNRSNNGTRGALRNFGSALRARLSAAPALSRIVSGKTTLSAPSDRVITRLFNDLFHEPISDQHQKYFRKYFGSDISTKTFNIQDFGRMFQMKKMLSQRLLTVFNLQSSVQADQILGSDIIRIARVLWSSPTSVKALILFKLFDEDSDNNVTIDEIRSFYEKYSSEFNFFKDDEHHKEVINIFLRGLFPINDEDVQQESLTFDEFYSTLRHNPDVFKSLYLISIPDQDKEEEKEFTFSQRWWLYIKNNSNRLAFLAIYILIQIALIIYVCIYRTVIIQNTSVWRVIARVGGMLVNFNFVVAVILMLKQLMTFIRKIDFLRSIVPVDDHIDAHRLVGGMMFVSSMVHAFGHTVHFATHTDEQTWAQSMFTTAAGIGWVGQAATITGDILFVFMIIMFVCALQCIRQRTGFYRLFQYTHLLFWPIFILMVLHAPDFWKWAIGPMILFVLEKIYLLKRYSTKYGRTRLKSIRIEDKNVLTLIIERPERLEFRTGSYINVCLPSITKIEWHPFTISSAPERRDTIRLNIMKKKNWTRKVYEHFDKRISLTTYPNQLTDIAVVTNNEQTVDTARELVFEAKDPDAVIWVEGPFSTCTSYIFDHEHVVLIGAGIGVTPSISALDSLIQRLQKERCVCPNCSTLSYNHERLNSQKLKKIDFVWINREIGNFSWFLDILGEFEAEQEKYLSTLTTSSSSSQQAPKRYLDFHLYCTSLRKNERAMLDQLPYDLVANMYAAMQRRDMHTKLKAPTHVGRPPWKLLFSKFKAEQKSTAVFFTGNTMMAGEIKQHCDELGFAFQHEPGF